MYTSVTFQKVFMVEKGATIRTLKKEISIWLEDIDHNDVSSY